MQNSSFLIGFDEIWHRVANAHDQLAKQMNYPPYNISKIDENRYLVELAVAGFGKQNIELEMAENTLKIAGKIEGEQTPTYIHKGIANRAFERKFYLEDHIEVKDAALVNGLLKIWLERIIPDHKKPRKIEVKETETTSEPTTKQLLTE